jgi:hypothetical protein
MKKASPFVLLLLEKEDEPSSGTSDTIKPKPRQTEQEEAVETTGKGAVRPG